jgi:type I restriction enzyme S subunit
MGTATKQQKKVPELRFSGFSDEWKHEKLKDVVTFRRGSFPQPYGLEKWYDKKNGVPFVQVFDVSDNFRLKEKTKSRISKLAQPMSVFVPKGSVVITIQGSIGRIAITQYDAYVDRTLLIFKKFLKPFDLLYFVYSVHLCFEEEKKIAPGGTIKTITKEVLSDFLIPVPVLEEQQKIAGFLGDVDAWLDNLRLQKTALETYKRGMMQKLFTQQIRFKDENGKDFPAWQQRQLGEIFSALKGSGISKEQVDQNGVNECILYGELYTTYSEVISKVKSKTNVIDGTRSSVGDLLIPCSTTTTAIDLANLTALNKDSVLLGGDITILRGKSAISNIFYAYYLSNHKKTELAKYGQGVTIIHIYYNHFKDMVIDVPSFEEQEKIADFLVAVDQTITSKTAEISKVELWKKGLMQKMFV